MRRRRPVRRRARRRRRSFRRRRSGVRKPRQQVIKGIFPQKALLRLPYVSVLTYRDDGANPTNPYVFRGNDLYQPEASGQGSLTAPHQPLGWDEWSPLYKKYRVASSTIELFVSSNNVDPDKAPWIVVVADHVSNPKSLPVGNAALSAMREKASGYHKFRVNAARNNGASGSVQKMKVKAFTHRVFDTTKMLSKDVTFTGQTDGFVAPKEWRWKIYYLLPDGGYVAQPIANAGCHFTMTVKITYNCVLLEREALAQS